MPPKPLTVIFVQLGLRVQERLEPYNRGFRAHLGTFVRRAHPRKRNTHALQVHMQTLLMQPQLKTAWIVHWGGIAPEVRGTQQPCVKLDTLAWVPQQQGTKTHVQKGPGQPQLELLAAQCASHVQLDPFAPPGARFLHNALQQHMHQMKTQQPGTILTLAIVSLARRECGVE
jgi:hypothetical protein